MYTVLAVWRFRLQSRLVYGGTVPRFQSVELRKSLEPGDVKNASNDRVEVKLYWSKVDFKHKMRIAESPVGAIYLAAILLTNLRNCVYPNKVSLYFDYAPPRLSKYL